MQFRHVVFFINPLSGRESFIICIRGISRINWLTSPSLLDRHTCALHVSPTQGYIYPLLCTEAVVRSCSVKKVSLEISQNSQENTCSRVSFLIRPEDCNLINKETLTQMFSCEFCKIFQNTFFHRTPLVAASVPTVWIKIWILIAAPNPIPFNTISYHKFFPGA